MKPFLNDVSYGPAKSNIFYLTSLIQGKVPHLPHLAYSAATALTSIRNSSRTSRSIMSSVLGG